MTTSLCDSCIMPRKNCPALKPLEHKDGSLKMSDAEIRQDLCDSTYEMKEDS